MSDQKPASSGIAKAIFMCACFILFAVVGGYVNVQDQEGKALHALLPSGDVQSGAQATTPGRPAQLEVSPSDRYVIGVVALIATNHLETLKSATGAEADALIDRMETLSLRIRSQPTTGVDPAIVTCVMNYTDRQMALVDAYHALQAQEASAAESALDQLLGGKGLASTRAMPGSNRPSARSKSPLPTCCARCASVRLWASRSLAI